jgi:hypothetical protein
VTILGPFTLFRMSLYVICVDETTDASIKEQLSLCVRFVENTFVRREFLGFVELTKTDAKHITDSILACMRQWGHDITKLRGKCYDGASVISGAVICMGV